MNIHIKEIYFFYKISAVFVVFRQTLKGWECNCLSSASSYFSDGCEPFFAYV